jgi:VanZ family protein
MAVIFGASSRSDVGAFGRIPDWTTHGAAYLILSALLCRALAGGVRRPLGASAALAAVALAAGYGLSDELHQSLVPGRQASGADVLKDLGGAAAGALLYRRCFGGSDE